MNTRCRARRRWPAPIALWSALAAALVAPVAADAQETGGSSHAAAVRSQAPRDVTVGGLVRVRGALRFAPRRRTMLLELRSSRSWREVDRTSTARRGRFRTSWRAASPGSYRLRVRPIDARAAVTAERVVKVYRSSSASWFGPGLYGRRTACGLTLGPGLAGVAHKTLPCGTRVGFRYGRRTVVAPVIDRGPYAAGREWDLTAATRRALGFPSTGTVLSTR